jgi:hypothetical protein
MPIDKLARFFIKAHLVFYFDVCAKFQRFVFIKGWCSSSGGVGAMITDIKVKSANVCFMNWEFVGSLPHLGSNSAGFEIYLQLKNGEFPLDLSITFHSPKHQSKLWTWVNIHDRMSEQRDRSVLTHRFIKMFQESKAKTLLDIGGRARSGILRAHKYVPHDTNIDILDIHPGDGVTFVCDVHEMSSVIRQGRYDAILSISVFEHLIMPWKVAVEMNRVLKLGGIALVHTHQTLGMHDMPWDYYRFSDEAWKGIFNHATGFEILGTELDDLLFIVPFEWAPRHSDAEKSAGFENSSVLVRKISEATIDWPLSAQQVTSDMYPSGVNIDRSR